MPRTIDITLLDHLQSGQTTTCFILKVTPVTPGYAPYGAAMTNRPVKYDDGTGELLYSAIVGMQLTSLSSSSDLSVDNAENESLMPEFDFPISEADIIAGVYDFAEFDLYLVNYRDLTPGRHHHVQSGTLGRVTVRDGGLSLVEELRGLSDQLKQSLCTKDSLSCRAIFGSGAIGSGAAVEEQYPCGFDADSLLVPGEVDSVGVESSITFTADAGLVVGENDLALGIVKWLTGANAGRTDEAEGNTVGNGVTKAVITLAFPTLFPVQAGDTFETRGGCSKIARDDVRGCKQWFGAQWVEHFRGEPDIPIGDAGAIDTPGASSGAGQGGATYEELE